MLVFHTGGRTRARTAVLVIATAAAIQLWPNAQAQPRAQAPAREVVEVKAPKKAKKRSHTVAAMIPWKLQPANALLAREPAQAKPDTIDFVLATARKQIGKPYRWGATGPSSFDCSGFTSYVWRKAGVTIPRTSSGQAAGLKRIPLKKARPGDVILSSGHVGLYVGKGKMIHSPRSGRTVEIAPLHARAYGAARPKA